ncbi:Glyoxalase/Bleomycin resistance protein/Dioxygenase superfamily protein [compost metagenome]
MTVPKVLGLNGFGLQVPDLQQATDFYLAFGLEATPGEGFVSLRSPGRDNTELVLAQGDVKRLHHVSFYIAPDALEPFAAKLEGAGLEVSREAPGGGHRGGLWFRDPWGLLINLTAAIPHSTRTEANLPINDPDLKLRVDRAAFETLGSGRSPLRIGHLLAFSPDMPAAERFMCEVLGMRCTDRAPGKVTFLAAGEGTIDHHCFGLIQSSHVGFQHASFLVPSIDDIGLGTCRMRAAGYRDGFGPGRHAIASNFFQYFRDPWGSWVEYYCDMDKITEAWEQKDWAVRPYVWGPDWSPEFWHGEMNANLEPAG